MEIYIWNKNDLLELLNNKFRDNNFVNYLVKKYKKVDYNFIVNPENRFEAIHDTIEYFKLPIYNYGDLYYTKEKRPGSIKIEKESDIDYNYKFYLTEMMGVNYMYEMERRLEELEELERLLTKPE